MASFKDDSEILVEIRRSERHADGVFAKCSIDDGTIAFSETPLHKLQSLDNRQEVPSCGHCFNFIGSHDFQLEVLEGRKRRIDVLTPDVACYPCRDGCGELYCSSTCADKHWINGHALLCTGRIPDEDADNHPLIKFKTHAVATNEIFLMVADVFASIVAATDRGVPLKEALSPFRNYVRERWWDAVHDKTPRLQSVLAQLVSESWSHLNEVLHLTERGMQTELSADYFARTIGLFEQNNVGIRLSHPVGNVLGKLDESDPKHAHALASTKSILTAQLNSAACMMEEEHEHGDANGGDGDSNDNDNDSDDDDDDNEEDHANGQGDVRPEDVESATSLEDLVRAAGGPDHIWTPLCGAAFYLKVCKINHSCEPNVEVLYSCSPEKGVYVKVRTLRALAPGEELLHSYVDRFDTLENRTAAIAEYGFTCACPKCARGE